MAAAKMGLALTLVMGLTAGVSALVQQERTQDQSQAKPAARPPGPALPAPSEKQVAVDRYGDPLPPGVLTRLGSIRLRHGGPVKSVVFTPDSKAILSGGFDGWAVLWDVAAGKRLRAFGGQSAIGSVAIDPKGETAALAFYSEGTVKLYELATGKEKATFPGHRGGTDQVIFSPDGKLLATGGKDKRIRLWNVANAREIHSWPAERDFLPSLRFAPDGKSLAYVGVTRDEAPALRFRNVVIGVERQPPGSLGDQRIFSFCFAADGKTVITGSAGDASSLQLWDAISGKEIRTIARIQGRVGHIRVAPDGKSVWTLAWDPRQEKQDLCQWDLASGKQLLHLPLPSYTRRIDDFALSPDGKRLANGTFSHDVFLWDTATGRRASDLVGHHFLTIAAAFTADGHHLYTGGYDETIRRWSTDSGEQSRLFSMERNKGDGVYSLALRSDGKMLAAGVIRFKTPPRTPPCDVRLWDLTTSEERAPLHGHGDWVTAVAFSPDGQLLASRSEDRTIRMWDVATGKERRQLRCGEAGAKGIAFSPDGRRVISALNKETIGFWDVESGRLTRRLLAGPSGGSGIPLLSHDGRMLVTGGSEHPIRVWEVVSGKERFRIERPNTRMFVVAALSSDCRILAWCDYNPPIKLWDLLAGKQLGTLGEKTNMASVLSLTFSADSRCLASTHSDGTALIWDMARLSSKTDTVAKISTKRLEELWHELGSADAAEAYRALRTLAATSAQAVPLLHQRLRKPAPIDTAKIAALLAELDSEQFAIRERATRSLQELGMSAEAAMRRALAKQPSLEVRRRLEQILEKLESGERKAEELQARRAVELLELIGTTQAQLLLRERSQGPADDWLTQEAKASLARLAARTALRP